MTLKEFMNYIQGLPQGSEFQYSISEPFSWRGSYDEVAFEVIQKPSTRENILRNIDEAYVRTFNGWKGGEFQYDDDTEVHFEEGTRSYTDGGYCAEMIATIEGSEVYQSQEMRLVKLAFN